MVTVATIVILELIVIATRVAVIATRVAVIARRSMACKF
jgi:hypothetical protein